MTFESDPVDLPQQIQELTARVARRKSRLSRLLQLCSPNHHSDELQLLRVVHALAAEAKTQRIASAELELQSAAKARQERERLDLLGNRIGEFENKLGALFSAVSGVSKEAMEASDAASKVGLDLATTLPVIKQQLVDLEREFHGLERSHTESAARQHETQLALERATQNLDERLNRMVRRVDEATDHHAATVQAALEASRTEHAQAIERVAEALRVDAERTRDAAGRIDTRLDAALATIAAQDARTDTISRSLSDVARQLEVESTSTSASITSLKDTVSSQLDQVARIDAEVRGLGEYTRSVRAQVSTVASELRRDREARRCQEPPGETTPAEAGHLLSIRVAALETAAAVVRSSVAELAARSISSVQDQTDSDRQQSLMERFYLAFENAYRGSMAEIQDRQKIYIDTLVAVEALKTMRREDALVIDLGCGRGEWLGLLRDAGFSRAVGVDANPEMVSESRKHSQNAECEDVLKFLRRQPSHCAVAITGLHIAEHMPFAGLLDLVVEARRVLVKSGILILETPNPENMLVATRSFHLDPTHRAPIPPQLLTFALEHCGFSQVRILRLHAYGEGHRVKEKSETAELLNEFFYCSQDYTAIGLSE